MHKPSSCASRAVIRWQWLSLSCSAELSLFCSSAALCWWADASSCSCDTRAVDDARSSVRRTWWIGEEWEEKVMLAAYSKAQSPSHKETVEHNNKPGWGVTGASDLWEKNVVLTDGNGQKEKKKKEKLVKMPMKQHVKTMIQCSNQRLGPNSNAL